jgi:hypothetical protein
MDLLQAMTVPQTMQLLARIKLLHCQTGQLLLLLLLLLDHHELLQ